MLLVAPPSPDYIPGLEEPQTPPVPQDKDEHESRFIQPHDLNFVPEPIYPEYIPLEDEHILSAEKQPLPPVVSPTAKSPEYVAELDPEEDPEEYEDDETEDGPVDYPIDGGDDGDDDDNDSSGDDFDDDVEDEEEEEEEHLAPTNSVVVIPTDELASPPEGTEPVIPPPFTDTATTGARITDDIPETEMPPRKRLCLSTLGSRYEVGESSTAKPTGGRGIDYGFVSTLDAEARRRGVGEVGYGIRDTWVDTSKTVPEIAPMTVGEVNTRVTELAELHEHDTHDLYALLEDDQDSRTRISQRVDVDSQRVLDTHGRDSSSNRRHETRDGRHAGRVASTAQIMAPVTSQGPSILPNNTNLNNMTPESVQDMIDQALLRNSTNRDGSHSSYEDNQRNVQTAHPCFYAKFMKCQPLNFKGTEGVVGLTRWIKKMETVFQISGCAIENQVKFATCTLLDVALTWWNGQIRSLGPDAYSMTWEVLKNKIMDKYCPQGEIKKLEIKLWNLKVKENNVPAYTERFRELTLICTKFVDDETEKIDKHKLRIYVERQSNNKRKAEDSFRNNHGHQQKTPKRQNVARVYNMGTGERKPYSRNLPKCTKCHFYHNGPCTQKCHKCNKVGHFARDCRSSGNTNVANAQRNNGANPKGNGCFECGATGHFKRDYPKLKNKDGEKVNAPGWVYAIGNAKKRGNASRDLDFNVVMGTFLLHNRYASILFDTGTDRSFISTAFSSLIDIVPTPLGNSYDVELANGKIIRVDTNMRDCTLNFLSHPFNIDLMPVELGSFDVIIGMGWLRRCHAVIVCDEKLVKIPYGNETLTFRGNKSNNGRESQLTVISCSKAQEYMAKGCQIVLAQISAKKEEDRSEGKQLEDAPVIQDYPKVFPKDLPGLPLARPVEF
nr:hypothetical protein [Tanacetum cinerariifolium]